MQPTLSFVSELPDPDAFEDLMRAYYRIVLRGLEAAGGPKLSPADLAKDTMTHLDELLPPKGRILLATAGDGTLVGCGVLRLVRPDAAELKRMYVRPDTQGQGLGRRIFEMRAQEARQMGCRTLYADTYRGNRSMLKIYENAGFRLIPRYPENANPPELEPYLVYLQYDVPDGDG